MRRQSWYVIGGAVLGLGIVAWFVAHRGGSAASQRELTPAVALATVREGGFTVVLDEGGFVGSPAAGTSQLAFASSGVLRSIYVRIGDRVSAGEPVAALDLQPLTLAAQGAQADSRAAT
ncbi:MAG: biotin/lipoyl-binding protein, partial [Candidatus Aquilonibacter sp.]